MNLDLNYYYIRIIKQGFQLHTIDRMDMMMMDCTSSIEVHFLFRLMVSQQRQCSVMKSSTVDARQPTQEYPTSDKEEIKTGLLHSVYPSGWTDLSCPCLFLS